MGRMRGANLYCRPIVPCGLARDAVSADQEHMVNRDRHCGPTETAVGSARLGLGKCAEFGYKVFFPQLS